MTLSLEMLTRSADGFAALEAIWEEARSRLMRAEVASQDDHQQAKTQIGLALPVFERLGSVAEMQRRPAQPPLSLAPNTCVWVRYIERLAQAGVAASVGTVGDSFDDALAGGTSRLR